jgi:hypothetical protein
MGKLRRLVLVGVLATRIGHIGQTPLHHLVWGGELGFAEEAEPGELNEAELTPDDNPLLIKSLAKYARISAEALARHQAEHDPARRR